jgi:penicillin-binding protein 2
MRLAELKDHQRELYHFQLRIGFAAIALAAAFALLIARFVYLQVFQYDFYHTRAEDNRISIVPIAPNRGLILDRNGVVLARNYSAYTLEIMPGRVRDIERTINELVEVVDIQPKDRARFRKLLQELRNAESIPIRTRLSDEEVARFAANRYRFPGVEIKARLFRQYPHGELASHVIGYIGRINQTEQEKLEEDGLAANYRGTDFIGKNGVEASYQHELHGTTGIEQVEIDAGGRGIRTLSRTSPQSGNNLTLTLDIKLQEVAEAAFGDRRGALVAIDPASGGVLALVSKPGFDPNLFVDGIDAASWETLNNSPDRPLNNRALTGQYPPGSTFKPFMALAALEQGKRSASYTIHDPGFFSLPGVSHRWRDWKAGGHGAVDMHRSIVISCDTYYYGLGNELGIDNIHRFIGQLGFGAKTGVDIDGEKPGLLPSSDWKMKRYRQKWFAGDTISVAIGQGYNLATPIQLAQATAVLAANGVGYRPHLVQRIDSSRTGEVRLVEPKPERTVNFNPAHFELIKRAMVDVTRPGGTAAGAGAGAPYTFGGKTGTAQVVAMKQGEKYDEKRVAERHRDHALFIAFAPAESAKIALAILVENGGHGSSAAAPIARTVLDFYLLGKQPDAPRKPAPAPADEPDEEEGD